MDKSEIGKKLRELLNVADEPIPERFQALLDDPNPPRFPAGGAARPVRFTQSGAVIKLKEDPDWVP